MSIQPSLREHWTLADLADLADLPRDEGARYEILDGELHVTTQPHWEHQYAASRIVAALLAWSDQTHSGMALAAPGVILADDTAVAPDVVWVRRERLATLLNEDGKLHGAPDLVVEVLSAGAEQMRRDREQKLALYGRYGVVEYWMVDRWQRSVTVYRRAGQALRLAEICEQGEVLTSPLLAGFACEVAALFGP